LIRTKGDVTVCVAKMIFFRFVLYLQAEADLLAIIHMECL